MRHFILDKIQPEEGQTLDNLGQLFNAYAGRLSMLESTAMPRESMREFRRLWTEAATTKLTKQEKQQAEGMNNRIIHFYHLQIVSNSLHELHRNVNGAIGKLTDFFGTYAGDLQRFAIETRLRSIEEYGSDEDSDWEENGLDADGKPNWKATYKDDPKSLKPYTLREELEHYFPGGHWRGEHIGNSTAEDFACYTRLVAHSAAFSPFKAIAKFTGTELPIYHQNEAGEMVPQTAADRVESEVNEELRDVRVACYFDQLLARLTRAAACYKKAKKSEDYFTLLGQLESIRDCGGLLEPVNPFND